MKYMAKYGVILLVLFSACKIEENETARPNILLAIADDASWKHFGAYGCDWVKTPCFDEIAQKGILFTRAYTPNAKCAPSRTCILTGRNSWQLEAAANHNPYFPEKFKTYAEALGGNGYWVGTTGKGWSPGNPGTINGERRQLSGPTFNKHKTTAPTEGISVNDYAKNFDDFLASRPNGEPFCFWYGGFEPHRKYEFQSGVYKAGKNLKEIDEVPAFWPDTDTVRADMLDYAFEIEYFDEHLQKMLKKLEEIGELENTLVIVTADNGMPFPRIKGQVYEYSNHLPLAIMWPNGIKNPGRIVHDFVNFIDFAPTFLELAGLSEKESEMQAITGKSLTDILFSKKEGYVSPNRDFILVGKERHDVGRPNDEGYPMRGIIQRDYLYIRNFKPDRWPKGNPETGYTNCDASPTKTYILDTRRRKGERYFWDLNFGKRTEEELYHIIDDPFCMNNLAASDSLTMLKNSMSELMEQKLKEQGDPRILGTGDVFDNYEYAGKVKNLYNRLMAGEEVATPWINKSDIDLEVPVD